MHVDKVNELLMAVLVDWPQASEINFTPGRLPHIDVHGELRAFPLGRREEPLEPTETEAIALALMGESDHVKSALDETGATDFAHSLPDGGRLRVNVFRARGNLAIVMRTLPSEIPTLEKLGTPKILEEIPKLNNGLVLVTGATGAGKSTTLAAIVDKINETRPVHIVTLENPVEFAHPHKQAIVNQRELSVDFSDYALGLSAALRQAPKVILVGEMRDRTTMETALTAASTGHLVLSTLHTIDAGGTIDRITSMFSAQERPFVRSRLAESLRFVIGQRLLPKSDGGRVAALEIMGSNLRVHELILRGEDGDKTFQSVIADSKPFGWQTFDQHIVELYRAGEITDETARLHCTDVSVLNLTIDRIKSERGEETSDIGELEMARRRF